MQVETLQMNSNCSLQHKPDKVYEWLCEELLYMDLLWRIQDLGQDVSGEDVRERQWRRGVPAGGTLVQWSQGLILTLVFSRVQAWSIMTTVTKMDVAMTGDNQVFFFLPISFSHPW